MRILRRYCGLTAFERRIAWQSSAGLVVTWAGLRVFGFGRWRKILNALTPKVATVCKGVAIDDVARSISRIQAAVERRFFSKPSCLEHALVLFWVLRKHGIPANIIIGGRKESERFEAHAWVEAEVLGLDRGEGGVRFVPFDRPITLMENQGR